VLHGGTFYGQGVITGGRELSWERSLMVEHPEDANGLHRVRVAPAEARVQKSAFEKVKAARFYAAKLRGTIKNPAG